MQIAKVGLYDAPTKLYDYYSDLDTEVGDYVLVPTPYGPKVAVVKKKWSVHLIKRASW